MDIIEKERFMDGKKVFERLKRVRVSQGNGWGQGWEGMANGKKKK